MWAGDGWRTSEFMLAKMNCAILSTRPYSFTP